MSDLSGNLFLLEPAHIKGNSKGNMLLITMRTSTELGCFPSCRFCKCLDSHLSYRLQRGNYVAGSWLETGAKCMTSRSGRCVWKILCGTKHLCSAV